MKPHKEHSWSKYKDHAVVLANKLYLRVFDQKSNISMEEYRLWLRQNSKSFEEWAGAIDAKLCEEAIAFKDSFYVKANEELKNIPHNMGGGALCEVLYFVVRHFAPKTIVETGVAAGFSTQSMFSAAEHLEHEVTIYSSDFPYFRQAGAEDYIGCLVDDSYKANWHLHTNGDQNNMKEILPVCGTIDFCHYDSDKRYASRVRTLAQIMPQMAPDGVIMIDDIHDNPHFYDFVMQNAFENFVVFEHKGGTPAALIQLGEA